MQMLSQNHRIFQVVKGLRKSFSPAFCSSRVKTGSRIVALGFVQLGPENLQEWKHHRASVPPLSYLHNKTCLPCVQSETTLSPLLVYEPNSLVPLPRTSSYLLAGCYQISPISFPFTYGSSLSSFTIQLTLWFGFLLYSQVGCFSFNCFHCCDAIRFLLKLCTDQDLYI